MSSPTGRSEATRSQDSVHASSQYAAETALEDTASSVRGMGAPPGVTVQWLSHTPNTAFGRRMRDIRSRSVSPRPRRVISPSLSVAQFRAREAEHAAATAISGVDQVAGETRRTCEIAESAIAEARSVHGAVESRVAALSARADESTARVVEVLTEQVQKATAETEAKASRTVGTIVQQLEKEITAAATSTAATAEITTRTVAEGLRKDVQAQLDQNRADTLRKTDEAQRRLDQVSDELKNLTSQLNSFKPASSQNVEAAQKQLSEDFQKQLSMQSKVSDDVQQKLVAQTVRLDNLSESVIESQKTAQANADLMQTLLVNMENLGEHFKQLQADLEHWKSPAYQEAEREYAEMEQNLLREVSLSTPAVTEPETAAISPNTSMLPVFSAPSVAVPSSANFTVTTKELEARGLHAEWVTGTALKLPHPGIPMSSADKAFDLGKQGQDEQSRIPQFLNLMGSQKGTSNPGLDSHQRRITPIPVSSPEKPSPMQQKNEFSEENQGSGSEIIQRLEKEKTAAEELALKYKKNFEEEYRRQGYRQVAQTMFGAKIRDVTNENQFAEDEELSSWTGGAGRPTIGETSISTQEAERIRAEVRAVMHEQFAEGRAALRANLGLPQEGLIQSDKAAPSKTVIDLVSQSAETPENVKPRSSFGSPVSVTNAVSSPTTVTSKNQPFATAAWKPKEPPCFFGRSTEDAHTWVSLVRNYLTFMSGSDSQQVAYTVTLFREAAHEWYMSFERRNRGPPRDWAGLVAALLDRFG